MTGSLVVLAPVLDGHPHSHGQGGPAVANRLAAVAAVLVGGDAELPRGDERRVQQVVPQATAWGTRDGGLGFRRVQGR
jgi:hypothetical protein